MFAGALLHAAGQFLLDAILPPRCLVCGVAVDAPGALCPGCWNGLTFLGPPCCACCGLPFDYAVAEGALCGACLRDPPPFGQARAALAYDDGSKRLVLAFKHGDRTDAAPPFGRWMARAGAELLGQAELVVPVPLHRWRLFRRRYNQAGLLALALGRMRGVAVAPDLLVRRRPTPSQGHLSRAARARNIRGAFAVRPGREALVRNRRIVLVDDVLTTGATVTECCRVLRRGGAAGVDVLTLARVVRPAGETR